jgi:uncharacterized protein involved in exopolysaccharide biosynthesis
MTEPASRPPERPYGPPYDDEISLRELYLILVRGLPLILIVTVIAAAITAAVMLIQPSTYEANANVLTAPASVQSNAGGALTVRPLTSIDRPTYEAIADNVTVFDEIEATLTGQGYDLTAVEACDEPTLEQLSAENGLTMTHKAACQDPELAAAFATTWAGVTVDRIRQTLFSNLENAQAETTRAVERQRERLDAAIDAQATFANEGLASKRVELEVLETGLINRGLRLADLDARIARSDASLAFLTRQLEANDVAVPSAALTVGVTPQDVANRDASPTVNTGSEAGTDGETPDDAAVLNTPDAAGETQRTAPLQLNVTADGAGDLQRAAGLVTAQSDWVREAQRLEGLRAERQQLASLQERDRARTTQLRADVNELTARQVRIEREVSEAESAYQALAGLVPTLTFVSELTPGNTRVLAPAEIPEVPSGRSLILVTALAAVVTFMAMTLFVFLREAVKEPEGA